MSVVLLCVHVFEHVLEQHIGAPCLLAAPLASPQHGVAKEPGRLGLQGRAGCERWAHDALLPLTYLRVTEATTRRETVSGGEGDKMVSWVAAEPRLAAPTLQPHAHNNTNLLVRILNILDLSGFLLGLILAGDLPITTSGTTCAIVSVSSLAVSTCSTFATVAVVTSPPELGMVRSGHA